MMMKTIITGRIVNAPIKYVRTIYLYICYGYSYSYNTYSCLCSKSVIKKFKNNRKIPLDYFHRRSTKIEMY